MKSLTQFRQPDVGRILHINQEASKGFSPFHKAHSVVERQLNTAILKRQSNRKIINFLQSVTVTRHHLV